PARKSWSCNTARIARRMSRIDGSGGAPGPAGEVGRSDAIKRSGLPPPVIIEPQLERGSGLNPAAEGAADEAPPATVTQTLSSPAAIPVRSWPIAIGVG